MTSGNKMKRKKDKTSSFGYATFGRWFGSRRASSGVKDARPELPAKWNKETEPAAVDANNNGTSTIPLSNSKGVLTTKDLQKLKESVKILVDPADKMAWIQRGALIAVFEV